MYISYTFNAGMEYIMTKDGKARIVLDPKFTHDKNLIGEVKAYADNHTAGNFTQAARELMAKGLVKGLSE